MKSATRTTTKFDKLKATAAEFLDSQSPAVRREVREAVKMLQEDGGADIVGTTSNGSTVLEYEAVQGIGMLAALGAAVLQA